MTTVIDAKLSEPGAALLDEIPEIDDQRPSTM
jgi:hypothetical protein